MLFRWQLAIKDKMLIQQGFGQHTYLVIYQLPTKSTAEFSLSDSLEDCVLTQALSPALHCQWTKKKKSNNNKLSVIASTVAVRPLALLQSIHKAGEAASHVRGQSPKIRAG